MPGSSASPQLAQKQFKCERCSEKLSISALKKCRIGGGGAPKCEKGFSAFSGFVQCVELMGGRRMISEKSHTVSGLLRKFQAHSAVQFWSKLTSEP